MRHRHFENDSHFQQCEVIPDLPRLHIYVQSISKSTVYRLIHSQTPISKSHVADHKKLLDELKETPTTAMPSDAIVRNHNF